MTRPLRPRWSLPLMPATAGAFGLHVPAPTPLPRDDRARCLATLARCGLTREDGLGRVPGAAGAVATLEP